MAVSEEFAHLMIRLLRDNPLVQRAFNTLTEADVMNVLGEEYNTASEYYQGNYDRLKEEAVGQILQQCLIDVSNASQTSAPSLWKRIVSYIKNLFKSITGNDIRNAVD